MITFFDGSVYRAMYDFFEEGTFGTASIEKGRREPGFVELKRDGVPYMNTNVGVDNEHLRWINEWRGACLIGGLGLGLDLFKMIHFRLLDGDLISRVDVVEIDPNIAALVGPYYTHPKIHITQGAMSVYLQATERVYDRVVFDVFQDNADNHPSDRDELTDVGGPRLAAGGTMDFWRG